MIRFTAEYSDRDELELLGAKWDFAHWKWCVKDSADYKKFKKWLGEDVVICSEVYIVETQLPCPVCGNKVSVAGVAFGEYSENYSAEKYGKGCINFLGGFEHLSGEILNILQRNFGVSKRYAEGYGYRYRTNGCRACGAPISDLYLYGEESPFKADTAEQASKLTLYEVPLTADAVLGGRAAWSANSENIQKFSHFADFSRLK